MNEELPNITGYTRCVFSTPSVINGVFDNSEEVENYKISKGTDSQARNVKFSASQSNSKYTNNNRVRVTSRTCKFFIKY